MKLIRYQTPQHRASNLAQLIDWIQSRDRQPEPSNLGNALGQMLPVSSQPMRLSLVPTSPMTGMPTITLPKAKVNKPQTIHIN